MRGEPVVTPSLIQRLKRDLLTAMIDCPSELVPHVREPFSHVVSVWVSESHVLANAPSER